MNNKHGLVAGICISDKKGVPKKPVLSAKLIENYGIENDAHASSETHRQVSLLSVESIEKMRKQGLNVTIGSFAENIGVLGLDVSKFALGSKLKINEDIILEITQIGKDCHRKCAIFYKAGYCIMPKEGIFAKVIKGGIIKEGDKISVEQRA